MMILQIGIILNLKSPWKRFYYAVIERRTTDAIRFVAFLLCVNTGTQRSLTIQNASELQQKWHNIFSSTQLKALSAVSPHDLSIVNEQVMIGAGLTFFNDDELKVINTFP